MELMFTGLDFCLATYIPRLKYKGGLLLLQCGNGITYLHKIVVSKETRCFGSKAHVHIAELVLRIDLASCLSID